MLQRMLRQPAADAYFLREQCSGVCKRRRCTEWGHLFAGRPYESGWQHSCMCLHALAHAAAAMQVYCSVWCILCAVGSFQVVQQVVACTFWRGGSVPCA